MACDQSILDAITELVKICSGVGQSIDYEVPIDDTEGMIVMNDLLGRVVSTMDTPSSVEVIDFATFISAFTANLAKIAKCVL
jgi:hypothetical protein